MNECACSSGTLQVYNIVNKLCTVYDYITLLFRFYKTKWKRNNLFCCMKHLPHLDEMDEWF